MTLGWVITETMFILDPHAGHNSGWTSKMRRSSRAQLRQGTGFRALNDPLEPNQKPFQEPHFDLYRFKSGPRYQTVTQSFADAAFARPGVCASRVRAPLRRNDAPDERPHEFLSVLKPR
jgi:hypothetical protein